MILLHDGGDYVANMVEIPCIIKCRMKFGPKKNCKRNNLQFDANLFFYWMQLRLVVAYLKLNTAKVL
jgi:hypothetical protein